MHVRMLVDKCKRIDMRTNSASWLCTDMDGHVCGRAYGHVYGHVHSHLYGRVYKYVYVCMCTDM